MQLVLPVKEGKAPTEFSSGQTGFSPDGKTFLAICENTYSSGTPLRCPLDIFAPALPPFPASRLRGTCLRRTPTHYIRSAHQCAGRAVYFAAAKYGKAGRPPGVATLVAVRGLVPPK